jgi:hypothetical protein
MLLANGIYLCNMDVLAGSSIIYCGLWLREGCVGPEKPNTLFLLSKLFGIELLKL